MKIAVIGSGFTGLAAAVFLAESGHQVEIFEKDYKAFTTGKSNGDSNAERIFYCKIIK